MQSPVRRRRLQGGAVKSDSSIPLNSGIQNSALNDFEARRSKDDSRVPLQNLDVSSAESAMRHIEQYDSIIQIYSVNARKTLDANRRYKTIYFYCSSLTLVVLAAVIAHMLFGLICTILWQIILLPLLLL